MLVMPLDRRQVRTTEIWQNPEPAEWVPRARRVIGAVLAVKTSSRAAGRPISPLCSTHINLPVVIGFRWTALRIRRLSAVASNCPGPVRGD